MRFKAHVALGTFSEHDNEMCMFDVPGQIFGGLKTVITFWAFNKTDTVVLANVDVILWPSWVALGHMMS